MDSRHYQESAVPDNRHYRIGTHEFEFLHGCPSETSLPGEAKTFWAGPGARGRITDTSAAPLESSPSSASLTSPMSRTFYVPALHIAEEPLGRRDGIADIHRSPRDAFPANDQGLPDEGWGSQFLSPGVWNATQISDVGYTSPGSRPAGVNSEWVSSQNPFPLDTERLSNESERDSLLQHRPSQTGNRALEGDGLSPRGYFHQAKSGQGYMSGIDTCGAVPLNVLDSTQAPAGVEMPCLRPRLTDEAQSQRLFSPPFVGLSHWTGKRSLSGRNSRKAGSRRKTIPARPGPLALQLPMPTTVSSSGRLKLPWRVSVLEDLHTREPSMLERLQQVTQTHSGKLFGTSIPILDTSIAIMREIPPTDATVEEIDALFDPSQTGVDRAAAMRQVNDIVALHVRAGKKYDRLKKEGTSRRSTHGKMIAYAETLESHETAVLAVVTMDPRKLADGSQFGDYRCESCQEAGILNCVLPVEACNRHWKHRKCTSCSKRSLYCDKENRALNGSTTGLPGLRLAQLYRNTPFSNVPPLPPRHD